MNAPSIEESGTHDTTRIDDVRIASVRPLLAPAVLLEDLPVAARGRSPGRR
jgi:3-deoxy-7-phosphoheptulonate synthase